MKIQWLGHSCFRLTSNGYAVVIDPYRDGMVPGLRPLHTTGNRVLCSHDHDDHGYVRAVEITDHNGPFPFVVHTVQSAHDDEGGLKRGMNIIHVLEAEGLRVAHLGDLGTMLTQQQIGDIGPLDVLMIPVGGHYTIDAATAKAVADSLEPRVILPMHYRSPQFGFEVIGPVEPFLAYYTNVQRIDDDCIRVGPGEMPRVVVMAYQ